MHSNIYELSRRPVPESEYMKVSDLPAWFFSEISDYADERTPDSRDGEIRWLTGFLPGCRREGDRLSFEPDLREKYFLKKHSRFVESAERLARVSFEAFAGGDGSGDLAYEMFGLRDAYDDRYGFYVFDRDDLGLVTLDMWIRGADLTKRWYVGGVIDYHW